MTDERGGPFGPEGPPEWPSSGSASPSTKGGPREQSGEPGEPSRSFAAGGAAADFVSSLGRKVQEMRGPLEALRGGRDRARPREDLRRRLHAVGTGARLFHFDALAQAVSAATRAIDEAALASESLPEPLLADLERLVEGLPGLAWHQGPAPLDMLPAARPSRPATAPALAGALPWTVLLVGDEALALALEDDPATFPCDIERTTDLGPVVELARALAPDLVVIDVDLPGALDALASLVDDAFTGPVPVVAVGRELGGVPGDARPKPAARLVALGVARALDKPFSPTTLREACADAVGERSVALAAPHAIAVGVVTPEALAERLVGELRRLLVDDLEPFSREAVVDLGSGAEVLGPVWGALAKVRDVVAHKSEGRIAYRGLRLDRPIALDAPLSGSFDEGARRGPSRRTFDVDLEGRTIVVADDDPAVRRFLAASLRGAGATVIEAEDGDEALRRAREHGADLLVVDVVMPGRDGASVARAVHHDPALRDRPVILLSWKEDLLRRLRDLRAGASSALRKDEDASVVVARAREALVSRVRVEARLAQGAEVRGRLDDLSTTSLLLLVQRLREQACVIVRDATFVWEAELENGSLVRLSRTGSGGGHGDFARGPSLLPSLLGVVGGRFLVRGLPPRDPASASPSAPLHVELDSELERVLTRLRAATDLFAEQPARAARVELDRPLVAALREATPPSLHRILDGLVAGASPAALLVSGDAPPSLVESLLLDLARRGAITGAFDRDGVDLLVADRAPAVSEPFPPPSSETDLSFASLAPPPLEEPEGRISQTPGSLTDAVLEVSEPGAARDLRPLIDPRGLQLRTRHAVTAAPHRSDPPSKGSTWSGLGAPRPPSSASTPSSTLTGPRSGEPPDGEQDDG